MVTPLNGPGQVQGVGKGQSGEIKFKLVGQACMGNTGSISSPTVYNVYEANVGGKALRIYVSKDVKLEDLSVKVKHVKGEGRCAVVTYTKEGKEPREINISMANVGKAFVDIDQYGSGINPNGKSNIVFKKGEFTPEEAKEIATGPREGLKVDTRKLALKGLKPDGSFDLSWMTRDTQAAKPTGDKGPKWNYKSDLDLFGPKKGKTK